MNSSKLVAISNTYSTIKEKFPENGIRKNLFLSACKSFDNNIELNTVNDLFPYGGLIGINDSYLDVFLKYSKVFRMHAILHDAAGAVQIATRKGPGYCYVFNWLPSYCIFGHVTGILFCYYIKLFRPRIFALFDC